MVTGKCIEADNVTILIIIDDAYVCNFVQSFGVILVLLFRGTW